MERSAAEYILDDPSDEFREDEAVADVSSGIYKPSVEQREKGRPSCSNPLRDEPHPAVIAAVRHFGIVGLMASALGSGLMRWCRSLNR